MNSDEQCYLSQKAKNGEKKEKKRKQNVNAGSKHSLEVQKNLQPSRWQISIAR